MDENTKVNLIYILRNLQLRGKNARLGRGRAAEPYIIPHSLILVNCKNAQK